MTEPTQLPADATPAVGAVYNYGGDNYAVTRCDPDSFVVLSHEGEWEDAVEFTDHVGDGETATITYVTSLDSFVANYAPGSIEEGAEVDNELPDEPSPEPKG